MPRRRHKRKASQPRRIHRPGTAPGTLRIDPSAPAPRVSALSFGPDHLEELPQLKVSELEALRGRRPVLWVNVDGLGDSETLGSIGETFRLHRLMLEDIVHTNQRPKVEQYPDHVFLVTRLFHASEDGASFSTEQISVVLGENYVLTFQERAGDCFEQVRQRIREERTVIRGSGADYLFYALTDAVVDHFFPVVEALGDQLERIEDEVIDDPKQETIGAIRRAKRELLTLRRLAWPMRDAVGTLIRESIPLISEPTRVYLRDCHDHCLRVIDLAETYREQISGLGDAYMSSISHRMNEVMAVLTIIATIFIPLGFIAGLYGMNFDGGLSPWNMPELKWRFGYPFALGLMAVIAAGMLIYFWRRGWIGSRTRASAREGE